MWAYLRHLLLVADKSNQSISYAANFGSFFFFFVFTRWSTSSRTSLLLILEVVDDTDDDFDTADIVDGDDVDKNSVDEQEDTVEGVEYNAGDSTTNESTRGDTFCFFFLLFCANLPTIVFFGGCFGYSPWLQWVVIFIKERSG